MRPKPWRPHPCHRVNPKQAVIGASLLYQNRLPEPMLGYPASTVLPIKHIDDIGPADAARLREQAQQARERIGPRFDLAFCQAGKAQQRRALMDIQSDLARHWTPVLQDKARRQRMRHMERFRFPGWGFASVLRGLMLPVRLA